MTQDQTAHTGVEVEVEALAEAIVLFRAVHDYIADHLCEEHRDEAMLMIADADRMTELFARAVIHKRGIPTLEKLFAEIDARISLITTFIESRDH